jgi:methyl-accepting chemotaxis protein
MDEVVKSIQSVTQIVQEISAASAEQTAGLEQINNAVAQIDETTQQNAALVEQAAAAAASMQQQSVALTDVVSIFKLTAEQAAPTAVRVQQQAAVQYARDTEMPALSYA